MEIRILINKIDKNAIYAEKLKNCLASWVSKSVKKKLIKKESSDEIIINGTYAGKRSKRTKGLIKSKIRKLKFILKPCGLKIGINANKITALYKYRDNAPCRKNL